MVSITHHAAARGVAGGSLFRRWKAAPTAPIFAGIIAFFTTFWALGRSSITLVETATLAAADRPLAKLPPLLGHTDAVVAPFYVFMHFWLALGDSLWWMRLPGVIACALTAALLVVIGRRQSNAVGLLAGLLFAIAPIASRYAEDARPYCFAILGATFATWRLLLVMDRPSWRRWAWYGGALVLLGLAHLFALLILPAHLWYARRQVRAWFGTVALSLLALSPLLIYGAMQVTGELSWAEKPGLHALRALVGELSGSSALTVLFALLLIVGAVRLWGTARDAAVLFGGWLVVPPIAIFAVSQFHPVFASRYLAFVVPSLCLLAAVGISALRKPTALVAIALVIGLIIPAQLQLRRHVGHDGNDLALMSSQLQKLAGPGDGVIYEPTTVRRIFLDFAKPPHAKDILLDTSPWASNTLTGRDVRPAVLADRVESLRRIWVVRVTDRNISHSIYRNVDADLRPYRQTEKIPMAGGSISLWVAP